MQGNFVTFAFHCSRTFHTAQISDVLGTNDIVLYHSKNSSHCTALYFRVYRKAPCVMKMLIPPIFLIKGSPIMVTY